MRLCSEQSVDKTDLVNQKDAESHAGQTRNRNHVPIDLEELNSLARQFIVRFPRP